MKKVFALVMLVVTFVATAIAHHSFAAEFDGSKTQTIKGVVTEFQWMNPHAYIYLDVTDASGKKVNWGIQSRNLSVLKRQGLSRKRLNRATSLRSSCFITRMPTRTSAGRPTSRPRMAVSSIFGRAAASESSNEPPLNCSNHHRCFSGSAD